MFTEVLVVISGCITMCVNFIVFCFLENFVPKHLPGLLQFSLVLSQNEVSSSPPIN